MEKKVLFVCTGNTCRSSMAEALARTMALEMEIRGLRFISAGTLACPGEKATNQAVEALAMQGIELSHHRTTLLTPELVKEADLVLTMTESHRRQILNLLPDAEGKVFTLGGYAGVPGDISDPYGSSVENYCRCAGELKALIGRVLKKLNNDQAKP
ncbi:protein tyrosine phosphatase [Desulforamulus profundi]|uniref:Protein tyrosine phosphatase n=1 Tax=Desulforamulus profundi TaxID=1383067 RepID=A0A2C6MJV9_9FIRM|nr:low molecular weight protein arginine phosphatase [Desulforamulus profundi]MCL5780995.1 low molecular weight protein arginine phosphatase [Bacillota bacterium]PHJ39873.1 protein tyrosine phosphatase [Desulforamulus profundi]